MSNNKISKTAIRIFKESIEKYHLLDTVDQPFSNPHPSGTIVHLLYRKNWIDCVQWHFEDLIRDPEIEPASGMQLKRKIDASNQNRTDVVEYIDSFFFDKLKKVNALENASINTESPAWAIDRLSILELKIYHMQEEVNRESTSEAHKESCNSKLTILLDQRIDLCNSIDQLLEDIADGKKYMKVYKQMKMYNDDSLNPVLYKDKS